MPIYVQVRLAMASQIPKTLGDANVSDRYLIDVDPRVFAIWAGTFLMPWYMVCIKMTLVKFVLGQETSINHVAEGDSANNSDVGVTIWFMMTRWREKAFRITGRLLMESTGDGQ